MDYLMALRPQTAPAHNFTPVVPTGLLQRRCACGGTPGPTGECAECRKKRLSATRQAAPAASSGVVNRGFEAQLGGHDFSRVAVHDHHARLGRPAKASDVLDEEIEGDKPSPMAGGATIQCDGSGGYEIVYGRWAGAKCGTKDCVTVHETSHMDDWKAMWPKGCVGQRRGYLPKGDPPDDPLMTVDEYKRFLKQSECKAHTADLRCAEALPKPKGCEKTVEDYIKLTREQRKKWCPRGTIAAVEAGEGALEGAGIGAALGGPAGAVVGAGVGALVGGVSGLLE